MIGNVDLKLSVGGTCRLEILEIEVLFTQASRPGRTLGESVGEISEMDCSDWSNGIQHHIFVTRPDTEFKTKNNSVKCAGCRCEHNDFTGPHRHVPRVPGER